MCATLLPQVTKDLSSASTTASFIPYTNWMPAISVKLIKAVIDIISRTTNFEAQLALQTATVDPDVPNAMVLKDTWLNSPGKDASPLLDISADVDTHFYVRLGIAVRNGTGTALERGEVSLLVSART